MGRDLFGFALISLAFWNVSKNSKLFQSSGLKVDNYRGNYSGKHCCWVPLLRPNNPVAHAILFQPLLISNTQYLNRWVARGNILSPANSQLQACTSLYDLNDEDSHWLSSFPSALHTGWCCTANSAWWMLMSAYCAFMHLVVSKQKNLKTSCCPIYSVGKCVQMPQSIVV